MRTTIPAMIGFATLMLGVAAAAAPADLDPLPVAHVRFGDLDMARSGDVAVLRLRITDATADLCSQSVGPRPDPGEMAQCSNLIRRHIYRALPQPVSRAARF